MRPILLSAAVTAATAATLRSLPIPSEYHAPSISSDAPHLSTLIPLPITTSCLESVSSSTSDTTTSCDSTVATSSPATESPVPYPSYPSEQPLPETPGSASPCPTASANPSTDHPTPRPEPTCSFRLPFVAQTPHGTIIGHPAPENPFVEEYLGIPYAQPPVEDLRFASPRPLAKTYALLPFIAADYSLNCPQTPSPPSKFPGLLSHAHRTIAAFAGSSITGQREGEDCLALNIWTKPCQAETPARPVMVFFVGGRFTTGDVSTPFYNGQFLANEDVVTVTLNYRTNAFGFPGVPGGDTNLGLRDQRLAVEWVRDNIAAFGGDPNKITIFGQSSGGVSVDYWSYAYVDDPIVSGLIAESGNALAFPMNTPEVTTAHWYNLSATLGCGSSGDTLPCMRTKPWKEIETAQSKVASSPGGSPYRAIPPFWPLVDNETVFSDYRALSHEGKFARIPSLLGNNNKEQGFYALAAFAKSLHPTAEQAADFLLSSFTCPTASVAADRRNAGVPTWVYRYFGDWENIRLYNGSGAYHGTELEMIFGNTEAVSGISPSSAERQTSALVQRAWAAFARDPQHGLEKELGWPLYDPRAETLVRLAFQNNPEPSFVSPSLYNSECDGLTVGAYAS